MPRLLNLIVPDKFVALLLMTMIVATLLPVRGAGLDVLGGFSTAGIVLLFFFHGARLSRSAVIGGFMRIRLHLTILAFTFVLFPLAGLAAIPLIEPLIGEPLVPGVLFLCALPTTIASSIAATSLARGNVAAAVIAAALSNLIGVVLTPLLVAALLSASGTEIGFGAIGRIVLILAIPFALGQLLRPKIGTWIDAHPVITKTLDRITILLAVYVALSAAAGSDMLDTISAGELGWLLGVALILLCLAIGAAMLAGRVLGFARDDRMTLLFAGIQKSAISGTPMARILFPGAEAGLIILPLLAYYIPMLTISSVVAARMGIRESPDE